MSAVEPLLDIRDLRVTLPHPSGPRTVVDRVSLTVGDGEAVGIVGESGSGKSMTARTVMQLLPEGAQVDGEVLLGGEDVLSMGRQDLARVRRETLAMIHQDPLSHINPVRTVGDFMTEAPRWCEGVSQAEALERAAQHLEAVRIRRVPEVLRNYPHQLSGGMLQRVMIAAALASEPRLILADEPTTALDVTTQSEVVSILDRLRRERGGALVFITHDLDLAAAICDRIVVMYAGTVMEEQPATALEAVPLHPYSSALLAARPSFEERVARLAAIRGSAVAAYESPDGCTFAPRCPHAERECRASRQVLRPLAGGSVACRRADELLERPEGAAPR